MASKAKKMYDEGLCIFALWFPSRMHTPVENPHAFRPILFDESSLITRLESWGPRKILTIMRLPCSRTGVNCEGERSLNTEAVFPIRAICLLVRKHVPGLSPQVAGSSAFHPRAELAISRCISKRIWKILCLSAGISIPSLRQELTAATLKGKPPHQKQRRERCYKQTWAKGSLWFSHEKVIRGVRAQEYPSRYFLWGLHLGKARGSAANMCRVHVSSSCPRSLLTSRAPAPRQAKAGLGEGNWCHHACVKLSLKSS